MTTPAVARPLLAASIGIDWADDHHDVALQAADSDAIERIRLEHTPAALQQWLAQLATRFHGQSIGIALETSRAPLVSALLDAPFIILYPVNPRSVRRFRETFSPNGAKDDWPDACLLLELLVKHRDALRPWRPDTEETRLLARLVEARRATIDQATRLSQQLQAALKEYYPQALEWVGDDLTSRMATDFLRQWPTLDAVRRGRPATLRRFYTSHGCRRPARIDARLSAIAAAVPLTRDAAVIESSVRVVRMLVDQLRALAPHIKAFDDAIAACFARHADAPLFASLPGAGAALAPRLLVAFGTDRSRFPSAATVQTHVGIAPITVRSGRQCHIHWRWATNRFPRQSFHEFAQHSILHCEWARAFYHQQRARGKSHHAAVRALAFKWIRIIWRCWQDRTPYDNARYQRALRAHHSPLAAQLESTANAA